jgi:hypothetical protein
MLSKPGLNASSGPRVILTENECSSTVLVSADIVVTDDYLRYAQGLKLADQLRAIYFDECHVLYTDTSYRAILASYKFSTTLISLYRISSS